jgi:myo-inositol 2-dehydrogenase / D-chiro-inositol 1-dehydrogenase
VRVGIVGTGSMGSTHTQAWLQAGVELSGVISAHLEHAQAFALEYQTQAFSSLEEMLEVVDVLDICAPTHLHREMTEIAAMAGKHIICEKPIALNLEDARAMIEACSSQNVRLFIAQVVRFFPQYRAAAEILNSGQLGNLGVLRLKRAGYQPKVNWFLDETKSGGMVMDLMIHDFDYALWLGGKVVRVYATSARASHPTSSGDYALVTLGFESGAMAQIEGGWAYPKGTFRTSLDIAGSQGLIEWHSDNSSTIKSFLEPQNLDVSAVGIPSSVLTEDPYTTQIKHFKHALETNTPFEVTPQDALVALEIALAARESLKSGRAVHLGGAR